MLRLRVCRQLYLTVFFTVLLVSAALLRLGGPLVGLVGALCLVAVWTASRFECVTFDGLVLRRRGTVMFLTRILAGHSDSLSIDEIEMVATEATRLRWHPDHFRYRYRTLVLGNNAEIVLSSTERGYADIVKALFYAVGESKLDPRSSELMHYFDTSVHPEDFNVPQDHVSTLPTQFLRGLANKLRLVGRMRQALNFFTLAYQREPNNPHLLYEMGRFLRSMASLDDPRLLTRSSACLRLAARISHNEPHLLERIGETYFERLEYDRASRCFIRALELDPQLFRAQVGLAEIALRSGKLAHTAHFYRAAAHSTADAAQIRLAQREADYYNRLCIDEDYFEAEIDRISMLNHFRWARKASMTVFAASVPAIAAFAVFLKGAESFGWSVLASAAFVWIAASVGLHVYGKRLTTDPFIEEE